MREAGGEYGTTTGRAAPRRLDRPRRAALRRAHQLARRTSAITKLDVLTGLGALRRLHALPRRRTRRASTTIPYHQTVMHHAAGEYEQLPGLGRGHHRAAATSRELPQAARDYLAYIADFVGVPIALIGVGPGRDQIIWTEAGRDGDRRRAAPRSPDLARRARRACPR